MLVETDFSYRKSVPIRNSSAEAQPVNMNMAIIENRHVAGPGELNSKAVFDRNGIVVLTLRGNLPRSARTTILSTPRE
jgi:hypothetical protein